MNDLSLYQYITVNPLHILPKRGDTILVPVFDQIYLTRLVISDFRPVKVRKEFSIFSLRLTVIEIGNKLTVVEYLTGLNIVNGKMFTKPHLAIKHVEKIFEGYDEVKIARVLESALFKINTTYESGK